MTISAFIKHEAKAGKKPATMRRYIATIGRAHIGAGLLNPCSRRSDAAGAQEDGAADVGTAGAGPRFGLERNKTVHCERALLCVAYETMTRGGELVGLEVRDIDSLPNGTGHALVVAALYTSGCRAGSRRAGVRLSGDHAGGRLEVDADVAAVDQCREVRDGESSGSHRSRRSNLERWFEEIWRIP
jgi:hypothetical protein